MPGPFSLYLDAVRFLAALMVVVAHFVQYELVGGTVAGYMPDLGREAVIVFFVLSGFVIAFTVAQKEPTPRQYIVARCARIYSVALPVLLFVFMLAAVVAAYSPAAISNAYTVAKAYIYIPLHMLFLGEAWNISETPPWLPQYWSLGYEVWYYVIFGAAWYLSGIRRAVVVGAILLLVGFKLWLLLPVWASGVLLYRWLTTHQISPTWARTGWILTLVLLCVYKATGTDEFLRQLGNSIWPFSGLRLGSADRYLGDYAVCLLVLANFACARFATFDVVVPLRGVILALASHTFTLYLVHGVVMKAWMHFYQHDATSAADIGLLIASIGVMTYAFGLVTERRKHEFSRLFDGLYGAARRVFSAGSGVLLRFRPPE